MEQIPLIYCHSLDKLNDSVLNIKSAIEDKGISFLQVWDSDISTLITVSQALGTIHAHVENNVIEEVIFPHTDEAFQSTKMSPPKMVLLQYVEDNVKGGELVLVDSKKVLESILDERPKLAEILMRPGCISFCQNGESFSSFPVYERMSDDSIRVHFRYDSKVFVPDWSREAIKFLHQNYHMNPEFQIKVIPDEKNQILILDNYRILYGQDAFIGNRKMHRVWINSDANISVRNLIDNNKNDRKTPNLKHQISTALKPPIIDGSRKPLKPGGYSDSGADIAYSLKSNSIPMVTPVDNPYPSSDMDWVFPDTEEGINTAISKGAKTVWANTVLFDAHPLNFRYNVKIIGQLPEAAQKYDNKWVTNNLIRSHELPVPNSILIGYKNRNGIYGLNDLTVEILHKENINFPLVLKPIRGRGSQGVKKVDTMEQLKAHAEELLSSKTNEFGDSLILEQYLEGDEITVVIMPPGTYDINFKSTNFDNHWHLPPVKRFNHHNGVAPYSGVVAVVENSELLNSVELQDPTYQKVVRDCERAGQIIKSLAPIRIDCRRIAQGKPFYLFDLNMKPNITGPGRPGRDIEDSLVSLSARGIGWTYSDLLKNILRQAWIMK
ncbi:21479_t:CDS:2 [Rhizophagus irregularis]|nr:21479_t:CDS:2 [Rhizophagus irregularis]